MQVTGLRHVTGSTCTLYTQVSALSNMYTNYSMLLDKLTDTCASECDVLIE